MNSEPPSERPIAIVGCPEQGHRSMQRQRISDMAVAVVGLAMSDFFQPTHEKPVFPEAPREKTPYDKVQDEKTAAIAASIREERSRRKAENFAKRNPVRKGAVEVPSTALAVLLLLAIHGVFQTIRLHRSSPTPPSDVPVLVEEPPKLNPASWYTRLDTAGNRDTSILTDPKTGRRWLIIGSQGTAIIPLTPEEFRP